MAVRVTQIPVEAIAGAAGNLRTTQIAVEAIGTTGGALRVTQIAIEIITDVTAPVPLVSQGAFNFAGRGEIQTLIGETLLVTQGRFNFPGQAAIATENRLVSTGRFLFPAQPAFRVENLLRSEGAFEFPSEAMLTFIRKGRFCVVVKPTVVAVSNLLPEMPVALITQTSRPGTAIVDEVCNDPDV